MCFCLNSLTGSMLIKICMFYALPVLVLSGPPPATCVLAPSQVNRQRTVQSPKYKCSIPPTDEKSIAFKMHSIKAIQKTILLVEINNFSDVPCVPVTSGVAIFI